MAFAQVGRQAEGSVGDRGCPLVSAGACPRYAPSRDLLGRAEPETNIPGGILAEVAAVEGVRTWVESVEDIGCNQARRAAPGRHRPVRRFSRSALDPDGPVAVHGRVDAGGADAAIVL